MRKLSIISVFLLIVTAASLVSAQSGSYQSPATGATYTGSAPIVVTGTAISCPTCGTSSGTVTSVSGTTNQVGVATGTSTPVISLSSTLSLPGTLTQSTAGAASTPPVLLNGTPFVGGTGTTNFPYFYMNFGAAPTTFSASGVLFGINTPSGFSGNAIELHSNGGSTSLSVGNSGNVTTTGSISGSKYASSSNCSAAGTAASPSVVSCSSASMGAFSCATNASGATCTVNTTAADTNADIQITPTASAGTRLSVTCNTTADTPTGPRIAAISNGVSFTINLGTVSTNPTCYFYTITN